MVINIRGTGGSGKSTIVRRVMALYNRAEPRTTENRKRPYYYVAYPLPEGSWRDEDYAMPSSHVRPLMVLGHYETPAGGCDTIKTVDDVYSLVRLAWDRGCDVLFEGIMVQDDTRRAVALNELVGAHNMLVVSLTTPLEDCLDSIKMRRVARGDPRALDPTNTTNRARNAERIAVKLETAGVRVERLDREGAYRRIATVLGWPESSLNPYEEPVRLAETADADDFQLRP